MVSVIKGADLGSGRLFRIDGDGASVASANAANVSMIRLTHSSCTAVSTEASSLLATPEMNVSNTAVMLTVI